MKNIALLLRLLHYFARITFFGFFAVFGVVATTVNGLCVTPMIAPDSSRRNGVLSRSFLPARISQAEVRIRVLDLDFFFLGEKVIINKS